MRKLEEEGYISIEKAFVQRKPRTYIALSGKGRKAFKGHVTALEFDPGGQALKTGVAHHTGGA